MSVYVDSMEAPFMGMVMCHMMADTTEELNKMADRIGVARRWLQKPRTRWEHYDICKSKRILAVRAGALEVSQRELAMIMYRRKAGGGGTGKCQVIS